MLRAGIVVTGTEVLTGRVADANGPWLSEHLRKVGSTSRTSACVGTAEKICWRS